MKPVKRLATCGLAAFFILSLAQHALAVQGPDDATVILKNRNQKFEKCRVFTDDYDTVKFKSKESGKQTFKTERILEIIPTLLETTVKLYKNGQYASAAGKFENAMRMFRKEWVQIYCSYYAGMCYVRMGGKDLKKGVDLLKKFETSTSWKRHRFAPEALYGRARGLVNDNKIMDATGAFEKLASGPYGKKWQIMGKLGNAEIILKGNPAKAEGYLAAIERDANAWGFKDLALKAKMLRGKAMIANKKFKEAENLFNGIVSKSGQAKEVMAGAYNGLGDCYLKAGGKKHALLAYLRVVVLYSTVRDEYAKALYLAAECFDDLGQAEYQQRATELRAELKERCPGSKWARK